MKLSKLFRNVTVAVALLAIVALATPTPAHAGVKRALTVAGTTVIESDLVAAVTHSGPGFSASTPVGLLILANHDVYNITDKLRVTVGIDVRSEFGFASSFGNLGIGGGLKYKVAGPFSLHAGYARSLVDFGAKTPDSPDRIFVGAGFTFKAK